MPVHEVLFKTTLRDSYRKEETKTIKAEVNTADFANAGVMFDAVLAKCNDIGLYWAGATQAFIARNWFEFVEEQSPLAPALDLNISNANKGVVSVALMPDPETGLAKKGTLYIPAPDPDLFLTSDVNVMDVPSANPLLVARWGLYNLIELFDNSGPIKCQLSDGEYTDPSQGVIGFLKGWRNGRKAVY